MALGVQMEVLNTEEAIRLLRRVEPKLRKRTLIKAINKAGGIAKRAGQAASPVRFGLLRKSLKVRRVRYRDKFTRGIRVEPGKKFRRIIRRTSTGRIRILSAKRSEGLRRVGLASKTDFENPRRYAIPLEKRHALVIHGIRRGHVRARDFLRKSFERNRRAMLRAVSDKIAEELRKTRPRG